MKTKKLVVSIHEIIVKCPVYRIGDTFVIEDGYKIKDLKNPLCFHSLSSIMPYYVALSHGIEPKDIELSNRDGTEAFVQCLDPCKYTNGGTVVFKIECI